MTVIDHLLDSNVTFKIVEGKGVISYGDNKQGNEGTTEVRVSLDIYDRIEERRIMQRMQEDSNNSQSEV